MTFIGARVYRYSVGSKTLNAACCLNDIGFISSSGIAQSSDFVDVDT
jgi:hypothetical protein